MASEIRVDKINSLSGVGTVTLSPTGVDIAGITTAATLKATTGIVTTLTATTGIVTTFEATTGNITTLRTPTGISTHFTADKISLPDTSNGSLNIGVGSDFKFNHDGTHSYITEVGGGDLYIQGSDIILRDAGTLEKHIEMTQNGAVDLYHNGTKKFETSSSGITVSGDNSTGSYIKGVTRFTPNDSTTVKVMWDEGGFSGAGHFQVKDNVALSVGDSSDLKIYHDGSHSYINDSGTGNLRVLTNSFTVNNTANSANLAQFTEGGSVELFHNGTKQCETSANGLAFPSGKGIDFSASGNAGGVTSELLDDYEEGSFTPGLGGQTASVGHANYTKIGNFVHIDFDITNNTGSAHTYISGLPFNNIEYSAWHIAWISSNSGGTNTGSNQIGGLITSNNMSLRSAGGNNAINIETNQRIIGSAQYRSA